MFLKSIHQEEGPRAPDITHAAVHSRTQIESPKLKLESASPKLESSGITGTTPTNFCNRPGLLGKPDLESSIEGLFRTREGRITGETDPSRYINGMSTFYCDVQV